MIAVLTPNEMQGAEKRSLTAGFSENAYMDRAGEGIAAYVHHFVKHYDLTPKVTLLCGKGNNAGDAFAAGAVLIKAGYRVEAMIAVPLESASPLCKQKADLFKRSGGQFLHEMPFFDEGVILDGLFGTGFKGAVEEPFASIIATANQSNLPILSIDVPSGLNGETGEVKSIAIEARETYVLGWPKTGFFLREGWNHLGVLHIVNFGLEEKFLPKARYQMMTEEEAVSLLPPIKRNRHKYDAGVVAALAGSKEMPGAARLSTLSALRGGAGLVRLLLPKGTELLQSPEVLFHHFESDKDVLEQVEKADAALIGPGLGREESTKKLLKALLPKLKKPAVIDADALTLIGEEKLAIPKHAILTPHHGEMGRLLGEALPKELSDKELKLVQAFAEKHDVTIVLKGAPTFIFHPKTIPTVNPTGCPGMATAGAGDVLTGLIAALLAQGSAPFDAARLAVYLHGLAGEHAEEALGPYCLIASDIIHYLPQSFFFEEP